MPEIDQIEKRVACASLGLASELFQKVIKNIKSQLRSKCVTVEGLENPLSGERIAEICGLSKNKVTEWRKVGLNGDFSSKNAGNSGRPQIFDENDKKFVNEKGKDVSIF